MKNKQMLSLLLVATLAIAIVPSALALTSNEKFFAQVKTKDGTLNWVTGISVGSLTRDDGSFSVHYYQYKDGSTKTNGAVDFSLKGTTTDGKTFNVRIVGRTTECTILSPSRVYCKAVADVSVKTVQNARPYGKTAIYYDNAEVRFDATPSGVNLAVGSSAGLDDVMRMSGMNPIKFYTASK